MYDGAIGSALRALRSWKAVKLSIGLKVAWKVVRLKQVVW